MGLDVLSIRTVDEANVGALSIGRCVESIRTRFDGFNNLRPSPPPRGAPEMRNPLVGISSRLLVDAGNNHVRHDLSPSLYGDGTPARIVGPERVGYDVRLFEVNVSKSTSQSIRPQLTRAMRPPTIERMNAYTTGPGDILSPSQIRQYPLPPQAAL